MHFSEILLNFLSCKSQIFISLETVNGSLLPLLNVLYALLIYLLLLCFGIYVIWNFSSFLLILWFLFVCFVGLFSWFFFFCLCCCWFGFGLWHMPHTLFENERTNSLSTFTWVSGIEPRFCCWCCFVLMYVKDKW